MDWDSGPPLFMNYSPTIVTTKCLLYTCIYSNTHALRNTKAETDKQELSTFAPLPSICIFPKSCKSRFPRVGVDPMWMFMKI